MKLIKQREISSVKLFTIEVSEDELDVYERCMRHIHLSFSADAIEAMTGATADELFSILEDVRNLLERHSDIRQD